MAHEQINSGWRQVNRTPLNDARLLHTATLLPDGRVLVTGGLAADFSTALSTAELFELNTDFEAAAQPILSSLPSDIQTGSSAVLSGNRFVSLTEGAGSNTSASSSDHPIVTLRNQDSGAIAVLNVLPTSNGQSPLWSDTSARVQIPDQSRFNGPSWFTVTVNGIRSKAVYALIGIEKKEDSTCFVIKAANGNVITFCL